MSGVSSKRNIKSRKVGGWRRGSKKPGLWNMYVYTELGAKVFYLSSRDLLTCIYRTASYDGQDAIFGRVNPPDIMSVNRRQVSRCEDKTNSSGVSKTIQSFPGDIILAEVGK